MNTYVAVNTSALAHNLRQCRVHLTAGSRLLAVAKAQGYGHGLLPAARAFAEAGADWLGVSTVDEGVVLREAGLSLPVLVFLPALGSEELAAAVRHDLTVTVVAVNQLHDLAQASAAQERPVTGQIYVDGGLGRLGSDDSLPDILEALRAFPLLRATGVYTHFGPPGSGVALEELEFLRPGGAIKGFAGLARDAATRLLARPVLVHVAASRLFVQDPASHLDMVRLGTVLYGQYPEGVTSPALQLRADTFALHSRIVAVHTVPAGSKVGYGGEFVTRRDTRLATLPVGLAHGLETVPRSVAARPATIMKAFLGRRAARRGDASRAPYALLGEAQLPLVGRVSMDQCTVDVTDVPAAQVGAEVTLPIRRLAASAALPRVVVTD